MDNGIDASDPNHMDDFLNRYRDESDDEEEDCQEYQHHPPLHVGYAVALPHNNDPAPSTSHAVLDEAELDALARFHGYELLDTSSSTAPMASYRRGAVRLNFWCTTGTVGSYLEHPRQGKTQLFRRNVDLQEARQIFENPRMHTGRGYQHQHQQEEIKSRGQCRYGVNCFRPDCWFDH